MEISKALNLLVQKLHKISKLRTLPPDKQQYKLWFQEVSNILELTFGEESREYNNFIKAVKSDYLVSTEEEKREKYNKELDAYKIALESALHKCALILEETPIDLPEKTPTITGSPPKAFISHGKGGEALLKLEKFLRELGVIPIIVKDQPNLDRTVDDKVSDYLNEADFVIIFATGDDIIKDKEKETRQPRQNVIHEIGLAQNTHPGKIIYLLEEGAEFPSNIRPKVYQSFARQTMDESFTAIVREMRNWGYLKVGK